MKIFRRFVYTQPQLGSACQRMMVIPNDIILDSFPPIGFHSIAERVISVGPLGPDDPGDTSDSSDSDYDVDSDVDSDEDSESIVQKIFKRD